MYNKTVWLKLDHITVVWFPLQIWWIRVRYFQTRDFRESNQVVFNRQNTTLKYCIQHYFLKNSSKYHSISVDIDLNK